MMKITRITCRY